MAHRGTRFTAENAEDAEKNFRIGEAGERFTAEGAENAETRMGLGYAIFIAYRLWR